MSGGLAAAGGSLLAACTSTQHDAATTPSPSPSPSRRSPGASSAPTQVRGRVDVCQFGAVGDGRHDDTAALQRAFRAVRPGATLVFPAGHVFTHSTSLSLTTTHVTLTGPGRLLATEESSSALKIAADGAVVDGLSLGVAHTTHRWSTPDQHKLFLDARSGVVVRRVHVDGSAAAGIFCAGAASFLLDEVRVSGTRADGIHMTEGAHDGRVVRPRTTATGDDGVAVVSYQADARPCRNIVVTAPVVNGTTGGRGLSVVGGTNVRYHDVDVSGTNAAAVYVACESGDFTTVATSDVVVASGRIKDANTNSAIDHGAVLVYSGRSDGSVQNVRITDLQITDTRPGASRQIGVVRNGPACAVSDVTFADLRLASTPTPYQGNAPVADLTLSDVRAGGSVVRATASS